MLAQLNTEIFNAINHFAGMNVILDKSAIVVAKFLPIIFILFLISLWFGEDERKNISLYAGYSAVFGILLNFLIGLFYFHPRPFMDNIGTLLITHLSDTSFPSDHTTFMLSVAFAFLYFKKTRKAGILFSILGIVGGIARVYCGVHYPFDILGSVVVAAVASFAVFLSREKLQRLNDFIIDLYYRTLK